ncbi:MAG: MFS transporter [Candidatus Bathyarchaeia archaeon]|jgi:MFS family permease
MLIQKQNKRKPQIHYGWVVATGGFLSQVILLIGTSTLPLILVAFEEALGISNADAGLIISMYGVFFIIGAPVWGVVVDRIGIRKALTSSSILTSIGIFSMGGANSLITCMTIYALIGFGSAALITIIPKLTRAWFDMRRKGAASSYIVSGGAVSASILGIVVPTLAISYNWRAPFYVLGSISLFISIVIYAIVRNSPYEKGLTPLGATQKIVKTIEIDQEVKIKTKDAIKMKITWHFAAFYTVFLMSGISIATFLVAYLAETGLPLVEAGFGFSVYMISVFFGQYLWGILSDYFPRKYVLTTCPSLLAVFTFILLTFRMNQIGVYTVIGLMGISEGGVAPVIFALISDYFNPKVIGAATGVIISSVGICRILAPLIGGYLATMTGTLATVLQLSIALAGMSAVISITLKRLPKHAD